jgi:hypothetical protein
VRGSGERARQSRDLIMKSGVACELHTLAHDAPHARIDAAGAQV